MFDWQFKNLVKHYLREQARLNEGVVTPHTELVKWRDLRVGDTLDCAVWFSKPVVYLRPTADAEMYDPGHVVDILKLHEDGKGADVRVDFTKYEARLARLDPDEQFERIMKEEP